MSRPTSAAVRRFADARGQGLVELALIVPLLLVAGVASDLLEGASNPGLDPHSSLQGYSSRGLVLVCWGLAAFAGTVGLSVLLRRTLPAFVIALVVCFVVFGLSEPGMRRVVLPPIAVEQVDPSTLMAEQSKALEGQLVVYERYKLNGQWWDGDIGRWYSDHQPPMKELKDANGVVVGYTSEPGPDWNPPQPVWFVIPGSQYWLVTGILGGLLLAGSAGLMLFGLVVVERRRPY